MKTECQETSGYAERVYNLGRKVISSGRIGFHAYELEGEGVVYCLYIGAALRVPIEVARLLVMIEANRLSWGADVSREVSSQLARESADSSIGLAERMARAGYFTVRGVQKPDGALIAAELAQGGSRKMMLLVNSGCNMACGYCYERIAGVHARGSEMTLDMAMKSVRRLVSISGGARDLEVTFFGGEPLLSLGLIRKVVEKIREGEKEWGKRFTFSLTTNGTLLTDDAIDFLVGESFSVMLSVDGPPEENDKWRTLKGGRGTGRQVIQNAMALVGKQREAGQAPLCIRATMAPGNSDMDRITEYFKSMGFERVMVGAAHGRGGEYGEWDLRPGDWEAHGGRTPRARILEYLEWKEGRLESLPVGAEQVEAGLAQLAEKLESPVENWGMKCGAGAGMQAITPEGKVYPCHRYVGEDAYVLGSVDDGKLEGSRRAYFGKVLGAKIESCAGCWARISCGGPCAWQASSSTGASLAPSNELCDAIRATQEVQLYVLSRISSSLVNKG